jgi:hypothetical protein
MYTSGGGVEKMGYQNPRLVKSPKGAVTHLRILYDGGEQTEAYGEWEGWSIAELEWYEEPTLACRWNGSTDNPDVSVIGNPQSHQHPTWFIIPKPLQDAIRAQLKNAPDGEQERALVRAAAAASVSAFGEVWRNPEDDVYDAL